MQAASKMRSTLIVCLLLASLSITSTSTDAHTLAQKLIVRRQTGETERETSPNNGNNQMQPARLYPDLPGAGSPAAGYPQLGPQGAFQPNFHGAPTPFVPFTPQLTPAQLSDLQRRMQQQQPMRPMSPSERLQSQTFTTGLGRRLLSMIGLGGSNEQAETGANETMPAAGAGADPTMRALQNSTVLQQLSGGVQSVYGSLSKMYNSTVQQQLNLLQERFKKEAENSTNPWQQRMSEQVPMFFKSMANKVGQAQENLNRIWEQMMAQAKAAGNSSTSMGTERSGQQQPGGFFNSFDRFMNPDGGDNFFDQFGRSLGFNNGNQQQPAAGGQQQQQPDLAARLMGLWHNQVQPQIGMVRGQIARVWRDLTASGALAPLEPMIMRSRGGGLGSAAPQGGDNGSMISSPELVDEILKEVDMSGNSEYSLIDSNSTGGGNNNQQQQQPNPISNQMQNRLITMQRELNQLWGGLTSSLQNAISNVRTRMAPQQQFGGPPMTPMASSEHKQEVDPAENEISGKVKDLSKLQKEADTVHDTLRQQQQQQRAGFGDRFRSFFNNANMRNELDQLPGRFSDSMSRFGTAVGDLWNQLPRRWDNLVDNMSPQQSNMARAQLTEARDKSTTTTTEKPTESQTV